ncbi:MAG: energy transducer TonB [Hymenobacter sp.]|nr:MAG: energy transducer TonB [Hymenobacter sp.]
MSLAHLPATPRPAPVGGYPALRERLRREAAGFEPEAPAQPLSGTVHLRLTIGTNGSVLQTKVLRSLRADYDAEAQRLVCDGSGWVPGVSSGKLTSLDVDLAVPF